MVVAAAAAADAAAIIVSDYFRGCGAGASGLGISPFKLNYDEHIRWWHLLRVSLVISWKCSVGLRHDGVVEWASSHYFSLVEFIALIGPNANTSPQVEIHLIK